VLVTTDTPQSLSDAAKTARVAARLDAPVCATLIRGPDADAVSSPTDPEVTERVADSTAGAVLSDPNFRLACRSIAELIDSAGRQESPNLRNTRRQTRVSSGGSVFADDN
jgi:MinD-like ATPase involved in chromosome partitioning or flagellar assembly